MNSQSIRIKAYELFTFHIYFSKSYVLADPQILTSKLKVMIAKTFNYRGVVIMAKRERDGKDFLQTTLSEQSYTFFYNSVKKEFIEIEENDLKAETLINIVHILF